MAAIGEQELGEELIKAHQNLLLQLSSSTSADHLLPLLQEIETVLSKVDQLPPKPLQDALAPLKKALVMGELMHHEDLDVRAGVAVCISEILGISAPHCPYDDDMMKVIFQLIVSCFKNLSDNSRKSHGKLVQILKTMATYRYHLIMLDLEITQTIGDMFLYFFESLRVNEATSIFAHMETIMTHIFEECEDISVYLIKPLLSTLRKNNEDVGQTAVRLAEEVIKKCAGILGPRLTEVVSSSATSFDYYSEVIASVCHEKNCSGENISTNSPSDQLGPGVQFSIHGSPDMERTDKEIKASSELSTEDVKLDSPPESKSKGSCSEAGLKSIDETAQPQPKSKTQISKRCRESEDENTNCEKSPKKLVKETCNDSAKPSDITEDVSAKVTSHLLLHDQSTTKSNSETLIMIKTLGSVGVGYVKCQ